MENMQALIRKIQTLPSHRIGEIEDFVDFITTREHDRALAHAATAASVPAFACVWDNAEDSVYDEL